MPKLPPRYVKFDEVHPETDEWYEEVTHPQHYQLPGGLEVLDLVEDMSFCLGNAVKYLLRAGRKPGTSAETDLMKAVFYIEREIARGRRRADPSDV